MAAACSPASGRRGWAIADHRGQGDQDGAAAILADSHVDRVRPGGGVGVIAEEGLDQEFNSLAAQREAAQAIPCLLVLREAATLSSE